MKEAKIRFSKRTKEVCVLIGFLLFVLPNLTFSQPKNFLFHFMAENSRVLENVLSQFKQKINVESQAALIVAPTMVFPIKNYESLEKEKEGQRALIGSFYTIQPFQKFGLKNGGIYGIILRKTKSSYEAVFVDRNNKEASSIKARVTRSEEYYPKPIARFNFNSPGMEICFDNICIEI